MAIEVDALEHLDAAAAVLGVDRDQAVRDAIRWYTARAASQVARRHRQEREAAIREAEAFDPIGQLLADAHEERHTLKRPSEPPRRA